jgi:hypothetical protein
MGYSIIQSSLTFAITSSFIIQIFAALTAVAETPIPNSAAKPLPKALSKVCVNYQTGGVTVRPECQRSSNPLALRGEGEVPAGTTNLGPRAYGFIARDGTLDKARSSINVSSRRLSEQVYCVRAAGLQPKTSPVPVTSVDFSSSECPDKPVLPISNTINSGCKDDEFGFIVLGCRHTPQPGYTYDNGNAFSFIIP